MAHISSNEDGLLTISLRNRIQVHNLILNTVIVDYTGKISSDDTDSNDANFIQHTYSPDNKYLAAVTGDKKLLVWNIMEISEPVIYALPKRPTCLCFCNKEDTVVVGDKTGDVYRYQISKENTEHQLILGHLSMVLDVAVSNDDSFIVSADRDEKIRVSLYPNAYNIHSYCLGHNQLVSTIALLCNDVLISASGDRTLRMWNYNHGSEMCCANVNDKVNGIINVISKISYYRSHLALMGEGSKSIVFFSCEENSLTYEYSHHLNDQPYDICYRSGKLFVLIRHHQYQIVILEKENNVYTEKYCSLSDHSDLSTASLPDLKTFTDLLKPQAKKRTNIEITPESTINVEITLESTGNVETILESTINEVDVT